MNPVKYSDLTPMQRIAYTSVSVVLEQRGNRDPHMAHIRDILTYTREELTEALRELCQCEVLSVHLDINKNPMFTINQTL